MEISENDTIDGFYDRTGLRCTHMGTFDTYEEALAAAEEDLPADNDVWLVDELGKLTKLTKGE